MMDLMTPVWRAVLGVGVMLLSAPQAGAQQRPPLDELILPGTQQRRLVYQGGKAVHVLLSTQPVEKTLLHYLSISRQAGWRLDFPAEAEAIAWLAALEKTGKSKVFMLNLYHLKSKINYTLTIGAVSDTRALSARSIITIYSMQRPFGR